MVPGNGPGYYLALAHGSAVPGVPGGFDSLARFDLEIVPGYGSVGRQDDPASVIAASGGRVALRLARFAVTAGVLAPHLPANLLEVGVCLLFVGGFEDPGVALEHGSLELGEALVS